MNKFTNKLVSLREGLGNKAKKAGKKIAKVAKGTMENLSSDAVAKRKQGMKDYVRERDTKMIEDNFGSEENYKNRMVPKEGTPERAKYDKVMTPTYTKVLRKMLK